MIKRDKNKKFAFSLAESVISMMLLTLTIMLTMSALTRKKHHETKTSVSSVSGAYACWVDNGAQYSWICNGNNCTNEIKETEETNIYNCIFKKDRRVKNYYIYTVGSRYCKGSDINKCIDGQVKFTDKPNSNLDNENPDSLIFKIKLGDSSKLTNDGGNTQVEGESDTKALGGLTRINSDTALVPENIESCKVVDNSPCGSDYAPACDGPKDLDLTMDFNIKCVGGASNDCSISEDDLRKVHSAEDEYEGDCKNGSGVEPNVKIKIEEKDSSLKSEYNPNTKKSEFVKRIKMLPATRMNQLYGDLLKYYMKDNKAKDGVVLILW